MKHKSCFGQGLCFANDCALPMIVLCQCFINSIECHGRVFLLRMKNLQKSDERGLQFWEYGV